VTDATAKLWHLSLVPANKLWNLFQNNPNHDKIGRKKGTINYDSNR
jgi:hypothetical protein